MPTKRARRGKKKEEEEEEESGPAAAAAAGRSGTSERSEEVDMLRAEVHRLRAELARRSERKEKEEEREPADATATLADGELFTVLRLVAGMAESEEMRRLRRENDAMRSLMDLTDIERKYFKLVWFARGADRPFPSDFAGSARKLDVSESRPLCPSLIPSLPHSLTHSLTRSLTLSRSALTLVRWL